MKNQKIRMIYGFALGKSRLCKKGASHQTIKLKKIIARMKKMTEEKTTQKFQKISPISKNSKNFMDFLNLSMQMCIQKNFQKVF